MDDWSLEVRVIDWDEPMTLETRVQAGDWSGRARAYASADIVAGDAERLIAWARNPQGAFRLDSVDTSKGLLVLDFYTIDAAGHARCAITLAREGPWRDGRPGKPWRFEIELKTELGLIERFARECLSMGRGELETATLSGVPD